MALQRWPFVPGATFGEMSDCDVEKTRDVKTYTGKKIRPFITLDLSTQLPCATRGTRNFVLCFFTFKTYLNPTRERPVCIYLNDNIHGVWT